MSPHQHWTFESFQEYDLNGRLPALDMREPSHSGLKHVSCRPPNPRMARFSGFATVV
jgi:hypothetical protein